MFVDESGTHISMDRLRSRAPKGERAYGQVPKNRGKNLTLIASMSLHGMGESMCFEGATDAKAFELYVEHFLAPTLGEGQVVVMDNLGAHRPKRIRELIEARGAELVYVPSYSPDLNPIEQAFSKIKNILRKLGARTHEALLEAMEEALSKITPADAAECRCKKRRRVGDGGLLRAVGSLRSCTSMYPLEGGAGHVPL